MCRNPPNVASPREPGRAGQYASPMPSPSRFTRRSASRLGTSRGCTLLRVADEIVGRVAELGAVEPFLERAGRGLAALALAGEAGIGKSTVWRAATEEARARGWLVL